MVREADSGGGPSALFAARWGGGGGRDGGWRAGLGGWAVSFAGEFDSLQEAHCNRAEPATYSVVKAGEHAFLCHVIA